MKINAFVRKTNRGIHICSATSVLTVSPTSITGHMDIWKFTSLLSEDIYMDGVIVGKSNLLRSEDYSELYQCVLGWWINSSSCGAYDHTSLYDLLLEKSGRVIAKRLGLRGIDALSEVKNEEHEIWSLKGLIKEHVTSVESIAKPYVYTEDFDYEVYSVVKNYLTNGELMGCDVAAITGEECVLGGSCFKMEHHNDPVKILVEINAKRYKHGSEVSYIGAFFTILISCIIFGIMVLQLIPFESPIDAVYKLTISSIVAIMVTLLAARPVNSNGRWLWNKK